MKAIILILLLLQQSPGALASLVQFQQWYHEYRLVFNKTLYEDCHDVYEYYLSGIVNWTQFEEHDMWTGASKTSALVQPVANCILEHTSPYILVNMASAAVLLGLAPTILATMGSSIEETSTLIVIAQRPLLGCFLALGSPSVNPLRTFKYFDPLKILEERKGRKPPPDFERFGKFRMAAEYGVLILEYLLASAAIVNMVMLGLDLRSRVVCTFAPHRTFLPLVWGLMGAAAHFFGAWALWLRIRVRNPSRIRAKLTNLWGTSYQTIVYAPGTIVGWFSVQFTPWAWHTPFHISEIRETYQFILVSWATSTYVTCHMVFGTLTFSGIIFISVRDATLLFARLMASVILCRIILMYEIAALRGRLLNQASFEMHQDVGTSSASFGVRSDLPLKNRHNSTYSVDYDRLSDTESTLRN